MERRSLSGSLDVTAGSGIWDSEGGATVGTYLSLAVGEMEPCLPIGALLGLAGRKWPAFAATIIQKTPRAVLWGCTPRMICILLLLLALQ